MGRANERLSALSEAVLATLSRVGRSALGTGVPLVFASIALGSTAFFMRSKARVKAFDTNKLKFAEQTTAAIWVGIALVALTVVLGIGFLVLRLRARRANRDIPASASWGRVTGAFTNLAPLLCASPFVLALGSKDIEKDSPKLTLFYCVVIAALVLVSVYRVVASRLSGLRLDAVLPSLRAARASHVAAFVGVLALWTAYGWFFTRLSITNHHALVTRVIDLGYYDNIFWQSIHGKPLGCTFLKGEYHGSAHFDPILVLLSPLYLLYPRSEFILGLQSVWVGSGVLAVYGLARQHLESPWQALLIAATYALHPAIHGTNMYEFHSLTLATVPVLWALHFLGRRKKVAYFIALFAALLVREDVPLMMTMVGVNELVRSEGKQRGVGLATIVLCLGYFVVVKAFFMTSSGIIMSGPKAYSYAYYYEELIPDGHGLGGLALSLLTNPIFVITHAFEEAKLLFLATVFLPMLFLPFAARGGRLLLVYGLMFCLFASRTAVFSTHFQYTNTILPFAFALLPEGLKQVSEGRLARGFGLSPHALRWALVLAVVASAAGVSAKFGGIVDNATFRGGFYRVVRVLGKEERETYAFVKEMIAKIPSDASVAVSNRVGAHVSNRRHAYFFGQKPAEYVFVDEADLTGHYGPDLKKAVADGRLVELGRHGKIALFKSRDAKAAAAEAGDAELPPGVDPKERE